MPQYRLNILAGPSGVGKTPLDISLHRFFPQIREPLKKIVLYNSRKSRPGEIDGQDYHFRSRSFLNHLRQEQEYIVIDVRGDIQAVNLNELKQLIENYRVFYEGNTSIALELIKRFKSELRGNLLSVFLAPVNMLEIKLIRTHDQDEDLNHLITELMYNKLKRRIKKQGKSLSPAQTENLKLRSKEAYAELKNAWKFDFVLPNHDGEDSEHWNLMPYPIGDARISLHAFADLLQSGYSDVAEKWDRDLIP